jgi:hypothetical protein
MIKKAISITLGSLVAFVAVVASATGPSNCPTGQTALAQKYGTSSYCAMNICVAEYKHIDAQICSPCSGVVDCAQHPGGVCFTVKYEARPRFPQPPSPTGAWGNQSACPSPLNTPGSWY